MLIKSGPEGVKWGEAERQGLGDGGEALRRGRLLGRQQKTSHFL